MAYTKKTCPHCEVDMVLRREKYPMGSFMARERLSVDIYVCPQCARVHLFEAEPEYETCPICGVTHHVGEHCVNCALDKAFGKKE